ncbi:MAG: dienelactone hydrolase family protein [Rhodothermales bacterium]|nr:dienelactone hydrolase family protein [Rhodothermales bacterium]MBO6778980.1 dienelactone hydrolase family protein [Rhodothermales bacterium]
MKHLFLPVAAALVIAACDHTYAEIEPEGPGIVNGIDLDPLFAPPTVAEVQAIRADWASRDTGVYDYNLVLAEQRRFNSTDMRVEIVSHRVGGTTHYGGIVVPEGSARGSMPVLLYLHGGDGGVSLDGEVAFVLQFFGALQDDWVVVVPSFRDEPLRYNGQSWRSDGPASPWNYDVDDAMALLSVAIETVPEIDPSRVASVGFSRGGAVAMLMSARDRRVDRVVEFFGPTDFFGPFVQDVAIETMQGMPRDLPGVDFMNENYLIPLANGEVSAASLRPQLVMRSAVLFVDQIAPLQAHHGDADTVVPVSQADLLIRAMDSAGKRPPDFEGFLYDNGEHNPITLPFAFDRTAEFLRPLVN